MKKGAWKRVLSRDVTRRRWKLTLREKMCGAAFRVKYATGGRVNFTMATECSAEAVRVVSGGVVTVVVIDARNNNKGVVVVVVVVCFCVVVD